MPNADTTWEAKIPQRDVTLFHTRFGGAISLEQQLVDLTPELPKWAQPLWKLALAWLLPWIRRVKIRSAMDAVDRQAKQIGDDWAKADRQAIATAAVERIKEQHPDAHVEVIAMPNHPVDAVYVEHPPDPESKAQTALGFGTIEIHAPWEH